MSCLAPLDKALVLILVPIWIVCFALAVTTQLSGSGEPFIGFSLTDDASHPELTGEFGQEYPSDPLKEAGLRAGDHLVRAGEADLRGVGQLAFRAIVKEEAGRDLEIGVVYDRGGKRRETSLGLVPMFVVRPRLAISFCYAASALFPFVRARVTRSVRAYFIAALCSAIGFSYFDGGNLIYVRDARHLLWLQESLGDRFVAGAVLHTGPAAFELAKGIVALPICTLWSG